MTTHDVDEAILLSDKVILMTNGPEAKIAATVVDTLPRPRSRHDIHKDPQYYRIRNQLVDSLVTRSKQLVSEVSADYDPLNPRLVKPGLAGDAAPGWASAADPSGGTKPALHLVDELPKRTRA